MGINTETGTKWRTGTEISAKLGIEMVIARGVGFGRAMKVRIGTGVGL